MELKLPSGARRVLLHSCCAPCSCAIMESLAQAGVEYLVFFYNPNIHPATEYARRKEENLRFATKIGACVIDGDYDHAMWATAVRGLESEPERGRRCGACFDLRLSTAAAYAATHGFDTFTSSLGISRWKDFDQVTACGVKAATRHPGLTYWSVNWRKGGRQQRMLELIKAEGIYRQEYCGCPYSHRGSPHSVGAREVT